MAEGGGDHHAVLTAIVEAIHDHGPISFAEYMELALYGPHGYYADPPVGPAGDFVTSPHVHPIFGQLLAEAIRELHSSLGSPSPFELIEVGAGDGTLLRQVVPELRDLPARVTAVERSAGGRLALEDIGGLVVVADLADAPTGPAVVLAHELLDNLPFRRFRGTTGGLREVMVDFEEGRPVECLRVPDPAPQPVFILEPGRERIEPIDARRLVAEALAGDAPRFVLAIDYGSEGEDAGEVHGYRSHRVVDDVLAEPGRIDITAGVPFADLRRHAETNGLRAFPTVSQSEALRALGFEAWASSSLERQADLLNTGRGSDAVRHWGGRSRATMLVDPAGLGRFRWSVFASPGLPPPAWLERARDVR